MFKELMNFQNFVLLAFIVVLIVGGGPLSSVMKQKNWKGNLVTGLLVGSYFGILFWVLETTI